MIEANIREVTKRYSWRGEFIGYQAGPTFVPADRGNADFRLLRDRIERRNAPSMNPSSPGRSRCLEKTGKISGYDTDLGFVPNDNSNVLNQLLMQSVSAGASVITEPQLATEGEKISALLR